MRKIILLLGLLTGIISIGNAQLQIQTTLPTVGLVQKNQLWNLVMINSTSTSIQGRLELVLVDRQTSQELMTASTAEFTLIKGSTMVNVNKLSPVDYNYIGIEPDKNINTLLPAGAFTVCYSFIRNPGSDKRETLAEECVDFDIEPLSPPMLSFPADSSVLEMPPTQFSWMPPTPFAMLNKLHYEVVITEIQPAQQAAEAVEENIPLFSTSQAYNNFMTYSAAQPAFEKEKWYAWQVIARDDNNYAGKSEVWVFKVVKEDPVAKIIRGTPFIKMKPENPELGIAPEGILKLSYFNTSADEAVTVMISDLYAGNGGSKPAKVSVKVTHGENQLQVNLKKIIQLSEESTYKAEIINSNGERNSVLFRVKYFKDK